MYTILVVVHVLVSVGLIGLVLIQHGKGADAGAAFGSGASGTVFGSRGSANFLTRATAWLAVAFFGLSLALAYIVHGRSSSGSVTDAIPAAPAAAEAPKTPDEQIPTGEVAPGKPDESPKVPQ
jgi:preprotein translocase subunit SecG